jgi:SAM-dependent methyltransferase
MMKQESLIGSVSPALKDLQLTCPRCLTALRESVGELVCPTCAASYSIDGSVPTLTNTSLETPVTHSNGVQGDAQFLIREVLMRETRRALREWQGSVLDVGCGDKRYATTGPTRWVGLDIMRGASVDVVASADALPFMNATFDHVLLSQVLEHVPNPSAVLADAYRVLRPGGTICVSAPQAWPVHGAPHDYYRFTEFGLRHLLTDAGFIQIDVRRCAGSFVTLTQFVLLAVAPKGHLPSWASRMMARFILALDKRLSKRGENTLGNVAVGNKP